MHVHRQCRNGYRAGGATALHALRPARNPTSHGWAAVSSGAHGRQSGLTRMTTHRLLSGKAVNGALIGLQTRVARLGQQASVQGMHVHTRSTHMLSWHRRPSSLLWQLTHCAISGMPMHPSGTMDTVSLMYKISWQAHSALDDCQAVGRQELRDIWRQVLAGQAGGCTVSVLARRAVSKASAAFQACQRGLRVLQMQGSLSGAYCLLSSWCA